MACMVSEDAEPVVHEVYAPSSQTWQYVVVDPSTKHCVLIDPVMDPGNSQLSGKPADELLAVVCKHNYKVDFILETHASRSDSRSGAWYLRMQLRDIQGYAPRASTGQTVSGVEKLFARKYGTTLQTNLDGDFDDGEQIEIGRMSVKVLHLPGICTPEARGYQIGMNLFGGHSIADLKNQMRQDSFTKRIPSMTEDDCHSLWESFQKILGLPPNYRVFFDRGISHVSVTPRVRFTDSENARTTEKGKAVVRAAYTTVAHCRAQSNPIERTAAEFMAVWEASRGRQPPPVAPPLPEAPVQMAHRAESMPVTDDNSVPVKKVSRMASFFGRNSKG